MIDLDLVREIGVYGGVIVAIFAVFKNMILETTKQNNDMLNHLMITNKQLHEVSVKMSNEFNDTLKEHTKAIQDLRNEISKRY